MIGERKGGGGGDALPQLGEDFFDVVFGREHEDQLQFRHLDVDWVVVFAEKHADIVPQYLWATLQNQQCVSQRKILHLRALCEQGHERR